MTAVIKIGQRPLSGHPLADKSLRRLGLGLKY